MAVGYINQNSKLEWKLFTTAGSIFCWSSVLINAQLQWFKSAFLVSSTRHVINVQVEKSINKIFN